MRVYAKLALLAVLLLATVAYTLLPLRCEIRSPRIGAPAILQPGSTFTMTVKHSLPYGIGSWRFYLHPDHGEDIELTDYSAWVGLSESRFEAKLSTTLEEGAYSLLVHYGDSVISASHALHIVKTYHRDLKIVQLADLPTLGNAKGDEQLIQIIDEINIINPDLVLFTGDVAYGASWFQYNRLYQILEGVSAPLILAPGNHEYYGWAGYLTRFGKPYHAVQYGDYRIINMNSGHGRDQFTFSQLKWLKRQLENSEQSQRIVQLHHPVHHRAGLGGYLRGNVVAFTNMIKQHKVSMVLSGHWHGDSLYNEKGEDVTDTWRVEGTPYVVTTTAGADFRPAYSNSPLHYGYRLIRYRDAELENFTYDYDGDGERDASSSIPYNHISVTQRSAYSFTVKNSLNEGFKSAMVHLKITSGESDLCPNLGQISRFQRQSDSAHYWIKLDIPAQREFELTLARQDACR